MWWPRERGRRWRSQRASPPASSQGRLLSTLLAAIAEFERDLIRERTGDGRKRAMAKGIKFGRKPKLSDYQREIAKSYAVDISMISRLS